MKSIIKLLFFCLGIGLGGSLAVADKPVVVATTTMVADMVRSVGGDDIELIALMGAGVDPHLYKPSARDIGILRKADVIFYNGLMLEGRMADVFAKMARRGAKVYAVTENLDRDELLEPPEYEGHWDPHVWFNPILWAQCAAVVSAGLEAADPDNAAAYQSRMNQFASTCLALDGWARGQLVEVPEANRIIVTSHDAFNYFGRHYGFGVVGVQGISTASEAGLADVSETVDFIKENKIPAIFVESSVSPAVIERIGQDAGVKIGGELFSDSTGPAGETATADGQQYDTSTWAGMFAHNINTITWALK